MNKIKDLGLLNVKHEITPEEVTRYTTSNGAIHFCLVTKEDDILAFVEKVSKATGYDFQLRYHKAIMRILKGGMGNWSDGEDTHGKISVFKKYDEYHYSIYYFEEELNRGYNPLKENNQVEELKRLVKAQNSYRENSLQSQLNDIARALKPEFEDFIATQDEPMDDMLAEICREKLKNVMKILAKKGVDVVNVK